MDVPTKLRLLSSINMKWNLLSEITDLENIIEASSKDVLIFKHSFRCSISSAVKKRLETSDLTNKFEVYLLDVVESRATSLWLAERVNITHESPQVLLIKQGKCFFHAAHFDITKEAILMAS